MFAFKRKTQVPEPEPAPPPPRPSTEAEPAATVDHSELLQNWMALAQMQQRIIGVLIGEITQTSGFVEVEADALSGRFQTLAVSAQQQTARVQSLTNLAESVQFEDENFAVQDIGQLLEQTLSDVVGKILLLSRDSMSMVYALDELCANVERVDACMKDLDKINRTTNMLALNARIEAERAGTAGNAFRVVASEVRELSRSTDELAGTMNAELKLVRKGLDEGRETLKRVATIDMSDNILAKDRLDNLIAALGKRSHDLAQTVESAVSEAEIISAAVDGMVTGIQFQDRTKQRLEHVVDTLQVVGEAVRELESTTRVAAPQLSQSKLADLDWVKKLMARYTMSEVRERFVAQVIDGKSIQVEEKRPATGAPAEVGSIELF
uniref:Methyl-accepting chemotaxis sensory transducer n=1 Tax=Rhodopseudomonas palustris (strain BisA53) TaxID=316055 RepID=Q07SD3_RHOP5